MLTTAASAFGIINAKLSAAIPYASHSTNPTSRTRKYAIETPRALFSSTILRICSAGLSAMAMAHVAAARASVDSMRSPRIDNGNARGGSVLGSSIRGHEHAPRV